MAPFFGYSLGIPAASHTPASDQPNMLNNNDSIFDYVNVDHIPFKTSGSGWHKQVTFGSNNVPGFPLLSSVLFTNNQDGAGNTLPGSVNGAFYYSGTAAQSQNQYVSTSNGSVVLFGGIIMKWGTATLPGTGFSQPVVFPVAFPNNCFTAIAIATNTGSNAVTVNVDTSFAPTGFSAIKSSQSSVLQITYIAIGN
jgi:hypothetical protein